MGDTACALGSYATRPQFTHRPQPWRAPCESRYSAQSWRTLQLSPHTWPLTPIPSYYHALPSQTHGIRVEQKRSFRLRPTQLIFRFRVTAHSIDPDEEADKHVEATSYPSIETQEPSNAAPSRTESFVAAMPVLGKGAQRPAVATEIGLPSRNQTRDVGTNEKDADTGMLTPRRSLEEEYGLLKEQVDADRKIQLASNQGINAVDSIKLLKRSKVVAKQVISQSSARLVGFVSQLWVSVRQFKVVALEVRPSLLSGEIDRVFLADVCQIGDVVLVGDESALENEVTALDCETLVGYDVVTEDGNYIGKIRDYSFDLHDGKLTSLDFDSVGFSLVPSSLISTYRLDVEEVMEILPDTVLVKEGTESRIRRLTKGLWQLPNAGERRRSQKLARSRMQKRGFGEGAGRSGHARPLPSSMRPQSLEGTDSEGLDAREELVDRPSMPFKDDGGSQRYRRR